MALIYASDLLRLDIAHLGAPFVDYPAGPDTLELDVAWRASPFVSAPSFTPPALSEGEIIQALLRAVTHIPAARGNILDAAPRAILYEAQP